MTIAAMIRTATRGESGTNRDLPGSAAGSTNGAGGRVDAQRARSIAGASGVGGAGSCMLPQTTRRGCSLRDSTGTFSTDAGGRGPASAAPALAPRPCAVCGRTRARRSRADRCLGDRTGGLGVASLPAGRTGSRSDRIRGADPRDARGRTRTGRHPPHRVRPDLAGARGSGRPPARGLAAGRSLRRVARQSGPRRARSPRPTTGSR